MRAIALSSTASFLYQNLEDKIIKDQMKRRALPINVQSKVDEFRKQYEESLLTAVDTEKHVVGDASETGLVKFVNSLVGGGGAHGLTKERAKYPEHISSGQ